VGRQTEVERLGQLWKQAVAGGPRLALLAGEPGIGKTRLAAELAKAAHAEGAVVLVGRCDEDLGVPYQPFVEALRQVVDHTLPGELAGRLGRYAGELVRLVPELADRVPGLPASLRSDPETERYRLFDATAAWLGAASAEGPVLVVLDDLQGRPSRPCCCCATWSGQPSPRGRGRRRGRRCDRAVLEKLPRRRPPSMGSFPSPLAEEEPKP
jgi:predicted ATPase